MIRFLLAITVSVASHSAFAAARALWDGDDDAPPVILAEALVEKHGIPGIALAVVKDGEIVFAQVSGTRRHDRDNTIAIDDRFHIGSCTKAFTSTLAGMLVDEGLLSWETTLADSFPELGERMHVGYREVTLEQVLSHRAGIMPFLRPGEKEGEMTADLTGTPTEQRQVFIERLLAEPPVNDVGSEFEYSNAGYAVAAAMIERAAGAPWQECIRSRIFEPLGMTHAGFGLPASSQQDETQPWGHLFHENRFVLIPYVPAGVVPACVESAGDINCSIQDLARFARMHLRALKGEEDALLSAETATRLHTPFLNDYAMGWFDTDFWGGTATAHNGSTGLFFSWMVIWPEEDIAIVAMSNAGGPGDTACREFIRWMHDLYVAKSDAQATESDTNAVGAGDDS